MVGLKQRLVDTVLGLAEDEDRLVSDLRKVAHVGKLIAPSMHREQLRKLEWAIDNDHSAIELIRRIVRDCDQSFLRGFLTLFVEHTWEGSRQRKRFEQQHGLWPPSFVVISPLAACNLDCAGCYAGAYGHMEPNLSYDDIVKIIEEARGWGTRFITISGGEPTLYWNRIKGDDQGIKDICERYQDMVFLMYTNGTLIDEAMAAEMAQLGNITPAISVEGFKEETDARRGDGVYDKVMAAMDVLREHKAFFGASVTYTTRNLDTIASDEFIEMLMDKGCFYAWYFMYVPVGRAPDLSLMVSPQQRERMAHKTWEWLNTRPIFVADFWNSGPLVKGCIAAGRPNGYMHINHQGDICPCVFMLYSAHNIHESDSDTPLLDAVKSDFFEIIRKGQREKENNPLAPCQIVDHPEVLKEAVESTTASSTQEGQTLLTELHPLLQQRAQEWCKIADGLWTQSGTYTGLAREYTEDQWLTPG